MKKTLTFIGIFVLLAAGSAFGQDGYGFSHSGNGNSTYIQSYKQNAYGPGVHSDATGKPFQWSTSDGQRVSFEQVKPNGYGLGVGMDTYGRPVKPTPWGR